MLKLIKKPLAEQDNAEVAESVSLEEISTGDIMEEESTDAEVE